MSAVTSRAMQPSPPVPDALLAGVTEGLNPQQAAAVTHGDGPLLIVAGAGTGKTTTLAHRVAFHIADGVDPRRILLLTFTRRAAAEMTRRVDGILRRLARGASRASRACPAARRGVERHLPRRSRTRLLRLHGVSIDLDPAFTILDRGDSEDLMGVVRAQLGLARTDRRFPQKGTCLGHLQPLRELRRPARPTCSRPPSPGASSTRTTCKRLFADYVERKIASGRARLRRPAALLARPARGPRRGRRGPPPVRPGARRRVPGHELAAGADRAAAAARTAPA